MLQNAYLLAKIGADTAEICQKFAKKLQLSYGSAYEAGRPAVHARREQGDPAELAGKPPARSLVFLLRFRVPKIPLFHGKITDFRGIPV